ncbi:alpha/beta hydrolase family protein [Labrys sp. La1]|uniref:alpha/beta hydrolase family protein n=1 Tax=Labrys sp. La1 TaxID=3404917 RepID=UPI003EB7ABB6
MRRFAFLLALTAILAGPAAFASEPIGSRQISIPDPAGERPLQARLWYPASTAGPLTSIGGRDGSFPGVEVVENAPPVAGSHALVLFSHGFGGNWRNLNWLAGELARQGYVVAAPDHPGTTTFDKRPEQAVRLWERPRDLSRVLDAVSTHPGLAGPIEASRIAAIGHSLGGWTVMAMAGGRYDASRLPAICSPAPLCEALTALGLRGGGTDRTKLGADLRDTRIGAVVSLDLGPALGFTPQSLAAVRIPVLVLAAGTPVPGIAALKQDSDYLVNALPPASTRYLPIPDATHFSFMQLCLPEAPAAIEKIAPGESFVCQDGGTRERTALHRQIADEILAFLARALPSR